MGTYIHVNAWEPCPVWQHQIRISCWNTITFHPFLICLLGLHKWLCGSLLLIRVLIYYATINGLR